MEYIYQGQKLKGSPMRSATQWNEIVRVVHDNQRRGFGTGGGPSFGSGDVTVKIRNDSGVNLPFGSVLRISAVPTEPTADEMVFKYDGGVLFYGDMPTSADAGRFMVTVEPIMEDGIGNAIVSGPAKVKIDVISESHQFADVTDGDTILTSGDTGVPILWKEAGTGEKWAIVNIGGGGSGGQMQFDVASTAALTVQVRAGQVYNFAVTGTAADIAIPPSSTDYKIWMQAVIALFTVSSAAITHAAAVNTVANWVAYPDVATTTDNAGTGHFPARRYILIAEVTSDADRITGITQHWRGPMAVPMPSFRETASGCYFIQ